MRTIRGVWPQVIDRGNLFSAARAARRGKRGKAAVAGFEFHLERNILEIEASLRERRFSFGPYRQFEVLEPKRRVIHAAPYRDRVIHHALMRVIEPLYDRTFSDASYACRVGKGTHAALLACRRWARRRRFVLKADVRRFFATIDHEILSRLIRGRLRDSAAVECLQAVLASYRSGPEEYLPCRGDDLFSCVRPRGVPIGNLTSQFFANLYLDGLDRHLASLAPAAARLGYLRYMDDFLVFSDDKDDLHRVRHEVAAWLEAERRLHLQSSKVRVLPVEEGIPFVGFRVYPARARILSAAGRRFERRLRRLIRARGEGRVSPERVIRAVDGWRGHARWGDTKGLCREVLRRAGLRRVLLRAELWRGGRLAFPRGGDRPTRPGAARRLVEQRYEQLPLRQSQQQQPGQSQQQLWLSLRENSPGASRAARGSPGRAGESSDRLRAGEDPRANREGPRSLVGFPPSACGAPDSMRVDRSVPRGRRPG